MDKPYEPPHISVDYFEDLTGEIKSGGTAAREERVGERIRRLRTDKGVSLEALAKATGCPAEELAAYENGTAQPQLGALMKLSRALDTVFGKLLSGEGDKAFAVIRKETGIPVERAATEGQKKVYSYFSLGSRVKDRHMEPLIVHLEESPHGKPSVHDGEEFIHVLEGCVKLIIDQETHELEPGDSVYYKSTVPHLIAAARGKAIILAVLYE
jgi:transcriptional regulator with XRE-family HTH domain